MKASLRGTEIFFDTAGMQWTPTANGLKERPVIFLLHGGPGGDHSRYKQHTQELAEVAQLVFIDFRGCGKSKKTRVSEYTIENNVKDIEALRKHLGLKRICVLGTSYGGMVAQAYAIRYSKHVDKLILVATAPSYHFREQAKKYLAKHATPKQVAICEHLWNGTFKNVRHITQFFKIMDPLYIYSKPSSLSYCKSPTPFSVEALNQFCKTEALSFNFLPHLKKILCPTLILAGKQDWVCSVEGAKAMAKHIPHARLKIFNHCAHAVALDAHEQYIKIIKKFVKS